jgi:uncharacterized protein (DUF1778 family)
VVSTLGETAGRIVQRERLNLLSDRDREVFLRMLDADAKPNKALRQAAKRYRKRHARMAD